MRPLWPPCAPLRPFPERARCVNCLSWLFAEVRRKMRKINYFALTLACFQIAAYSQGVPYPGDAPSVYVVRVISVGPAQRDAFVACLAQNDLPFWRGLKEK